MYRNLHSALVLTCVGSNVADSVTLLWGNSADQKTQLTSFICVIYQILFTFHQNILKDCIQNLVRIKCIFSSLFKVPVG